MPTNGQDKAFRDTLIADDLLDTSIEWIQNNLDPDDVFNEAQLQDWALSNGYKKED